MSLPARIPGVPLCGTPSEDLYALTSAAVQGPALCRLQRFCISHLVGFRLTAVLDPSKAAARTYISCCLLRCAVLCCAVQTQHTLLLEHATSRPAWQDDVYPRAELSQCSCTHSPWPPCAILPYADPQRATSHAPSKHHRRTP
jgi:hypothetical protein